MAKQKKRKKKHKAPMPPLSPLDKFIYIALIAISILFYLGLGILLIIIRKHIAYADITVIAYCNTIGQLLFLPFMLFILLFCFIPLSAHLCTKTPIFGKKGITYGPPLYDSKYPVFMKSKPSVYIKPSEKQWRKTKRILVLIIFVITLIPFAFSFCGRKCLTNDATLQQYNAVNIKTAEYTVDKIESTTLRAYYNLGGRYSTGYWTICIEFTTEDSKNFEFDFSDFKPFGKGATTDTLNILLNIKSKLNPNIIEYVGIDNLEYVIEDKSLDEKETEMLYKLFAQTN